jgi:hypothetical protein
MKRDANYNMSPVAGGRMRPEVIVDRVQVGDQGPDRLRGLTSMSPIAARPTAAGPFEQPAPAGHISDGIRAKLRHHPDQAGEIRRVARGK